MSKNRVHTANFCSTFFFFRNARNLLLIISFYMGLISGYLGYDIEVGLVDGNKRYYEVKSVNSLGDVFSFSNNEYTTAMQYKKSYYLAIACQSDSQITICFVSDPINTLAMTKRVTRWDWICNEYSGEVVTADME